MWFIFLFIIDFIIAKTIYYDSVLGYKCEKNEHCAGLVPNSMCFNNKCVCQSGYKSDEIFRCTSEIRHRRQINFGKRNLRIQMLGEECKSNDECRRTPVDGTKVCLLNRCQCSSGHVPIDAYRCIRDFEQLSSNTRIIKTSEIEEPPGYGSMCLTTKDCQHSTAQLECFRGTCVCLEGYVPLGKYLCYNIRTQDASIIESSTFPSTLSITTSTFNRPNNAFVKSLGKLGNTCTNDYYCRRSVSHSHCYNGKCSCINGYISVDSYTCIEDTNADLTVSFAGYKSLLGGKCRTNQNCHTSDAICLNNICTCPKNYFPIDNWNCLKDPDASSEELIQTTTIVSTTTTTTTTATTTGFLWWPWSPSSTTRQSLINLKNIFPFRCLLNRQCISMDRNSHCTSFGRCVCNIGFKLEMTNNGQRCVRKIINDDDCD
ncbi:unnamed protein product [Rotaria sp. Silwood2]|nr:unnamed protein product [Rotaria sp. Silwood2]CAF2556009.1 unnamed protein product [Rotaria sp. Silwood2]CAF2979597.1 unnamed protein product [Rotaria sp. Silwood2]CAF3866941.1 unnamed protein product [Rotaria sp. Silwood2]CAF4075978.1 unnamed protein product [Rotaria sp. Silwood2]